MLIEILDIVFKILATFVAAGLLSIWFLWPKNEKPATKLDITLLIVSLFITIIVISGKFKLFYLTIFG